MVKQCWLDIRSARDDKKALVEEAIHQRVDGVVASDTDDLAPLPPTIKKILFPPGSVLPDHVDGVDIVVVDGEGGGGSGLAGAATDRAQLEVGEYVEISDPDSLELACRVARSDEWSVLRFCDPTKIPLEIVLAAADKARGHVVTVVDSVAEAEIVFGVLEHGSDGVMLAPQSVGEVTRLKAAAEASTPDLELVDLQVTGITDVGMGDRVCVDTCSQFRGDEGILVGSYSRGMILCCSETHPLPYMPTRPFRVNAGALHSYTMRPNLHTSYLSELRSGGQVLAVDSSGRTRPVVVGRTKVECRPMLSIDAVSPSGRQVNLIVQHDWHVRVLGPGGVVLNTTDFKPGDTMLGYLPTEARHVGYAIDEFCVET